MRSSLPTMAALLALALAAPAGAQQVKLGFIDSQRIVQEAPGYQQAQQSLEQEIESYRTEVQSLGEELEQMIQRFEQQRTTLSDSARSAREEEIMQQQQSYQVRIQQLEQQAAQRQQQLLQPIMEQINQVIEQIRREGSYTMIFDGAAQGILAADPGLDLTSEVIRRLRESAGVAGDGSGDDQGNGSPNGGNP